MNKTKEAKKYLFIENITKKPKTMPMRRIS